MPVISAADGAVADMYKNNRNFEQPSEQQLQHDTALTARHLRKQFKGEGEVPVVAVSDFTVDMFEGQIFALLGECVARAFLFKQVS